MAKLSLDEFKKDSKKDGKLSDILDLKSLGKLIVFLHPKSGIESRKVHYLPIVKEVEVTKRGKKITESQVASQFVVCSGFDDCPIDQLKSALRKDDNLGDDDVIFEVGEGKNKTEYTKGDILGVEGYDWKHNVRTITEYLFGAIDKDNITKGSQILIAPKSLGKAITKVIENQTEQAEEEGDAEQGDPFKNPYAMKLTYNEDEQPSLMYSADYFKTKMTKDIQKILDGDGSDLEVLTRPTPIKDIVAILRDILVVDIEGYDLDEWEEKGKSETKNSGKKTEKEVDGNSEEDLNNMDDDELKALAEEYEIEPEYTGKGAKKKLNKKALIEAILEAQGETEEDDDDSSESEDEVVTEEELNEMDDKELLEVAEELEIEPEYIGKGAKKKLNRKTLIEAILEAQDSEEDDEEEPDSDPEDEIEGYTEESLNEMDDAELLEVAEEFEVEAEYTGKGAKKKLNKKALIEAILEAQEEAGEGYTEEELSELDDKELSEVAEEYEVELSYTGKGAKKKLNREAIIEAILEAQDSEEDEDENGEDEGYTEETLEELNDEELTKVAEELEVKLSFTGRGAKKKLNREAVIALILEAQDSEEDEEEKKTEKVGKSSKGGKKIKVECPACGGEVDEDAESCPHCKAEFSGEQEIICPDCGTANPDTASKCKKCKSDLIPF